MSEEIFVKKLFKYLNIFVTLWSRLLHSMVSISSQNEPKSGQPTGERIALERRKRRCNASILCLLLLAHFIRPKTSTCSDTQTHFTLGKWFTVGMISVILKRPNYVGKDHPNKSLSFSISQNFRLN